MKDVGLAADQDRVAPRLWDGFLTDKVPTLTPEERECFAGKRIFITGAGGYLGSALARALGRMSVSRLVLLDIAEYGLYRLEQHFHKMRHAPECMLRVGSVGDVTLVRELFAEHAPDIVFHAAALKHVPLMEANAFAAAETNVLGTQAMLEATAEAKVESFVFVSTDKAVEPISVMGATKRIAEQLVLSARDERRIVNAARLCNVLGSTGSVAPLFARQIAKGGPVTVTHPEATRYFISQTDAGRHLLRAAINKPSTGLIVPVIGEPICIGDLARYMMQRLRIPSQPIRIEYTGLRAADKLHEQLISSRERVQAQNALPSALGVESPFDLLLLKEALTETRLAVSSRDHSRLMRAIQPGVPEYLSQQVGAHQNVGAAA